MDTATLVALARYFMMPRATYSIARLCFWSVLGILFLSSYVFGLLGVYKHLNLNYEEACACFLIGGVLFFTAILLLTFYGLKNKLRPKKEKISAIDTLMDTSMRALRPLEKHLRTTAPILAVLLASGAGFITEKFWEQSKKEL